jgi:cobalt-zinc-cadmium efflux system protein
MSGTHEAPENLDNRLKIGLLLNTTFTVIEFVIGIFSGSLALIADSAHNLTDSLSLIISIFANKLSKKEATLDKTYGYGRASILAALLNSIILFGVAVYIFYEAYGRLLNPPKVEGNLVILAAFFGFIINGGIALSFLKGKKDLNIKSTIINFATDALAQLGTIIAGVIILVTHQSIADPIISIIIGILLIYSAWEVVKDALHVLLEGVPEDINIEEVKKAILSVPGVKGLDDLHIWGLSSHYSALSCHIIVKKMTLEESCSITQQIKQKLAEEFHIEHATLEPELTEGPHDDEHMDEGV